METIDIQEFARPNILALKPYSSARDEFSGTKGIFLDANENPFGTLNRYPDPHQKALKTALSEIKQLPEEQIFIGNGSDEIIDLIYRVFCEPRKDSAIICPPTYGMYEVSANINDVNIIRVPLKFDFQLNTEEILKQRAKLIFLCSPNNPTGNRLENMEVILKNFHGIVVVDEAYVDFCTDKSLLPHMHEHPNLIVMQTFSKARALASARVGMAFANEKIISLFNKTKPPYNVSGLNQQAALDALSRTNEFEERRDTILRQRKFLSQELDRKSVV